MVKDIRAWEASRPLFKFWRWAKRRCTDRKHRSNAHYRKNKIKFRLSVKDVELAWHRDEAAKMAKPSIDRIDPKGDYVSSNIRFIEFTENSGRARRRTA